MRTGEVVCNPRGKKKGDNAGVRVEIEDMVEAIKMVSECELNSAPPNKRKFGDPECKRKLGSPDMPERIEVHKDLKRELKKLKQKFAKEYYDNRMYPPKVFFLV